MPPPPVPGAPQADTAHAENLPRRSVAFGSFLALAGFVLYGVLFYREILFHARVYTFRDLYPLFLGMEHLARIFGAWHWPPLWNPLEVLGRPFAADLQAGVFYPPNWCFRHVPEPFGINLSICFHHTIAAWGAFVLLRHRGLPAVAAALGGVVFGFGGTLVSLDNLLNGLQSAAWLPWLVLAFDRWCDWQTGSSLVLVVLAIALTILGGMPEFVVIGTTILLAFACDRHSSRLGPSLLRLLTGLAVAHLLAVGLCAVAIVPFAEYVIASTRRAGLDVNDVLKYSLQPFGVLSFILPRRLFLADGSLHITAGLWERALSRTPFLLTLYAGAGVIFLVQAATPLSKVRRRWWLGFGAVFLVLALGENIPGARDAVGYFPLLRLARSPEKFVLGAHALLAVGVAIGLACSVRHPERFRSVASVTAAVAVAMAAAAVMAGWLGQPFASPVMQSDLTKQAVLFALAATLARFGGQAPQVIGVMFLILCAADLYRVNTGLMPTVNWSDVTAVPRPLALMERSHLPLRIFGDEPGPVREARHPDAFLKRRDSFAAQGPNMYLVANLNTPAPLNLSDRNRLASLIADLSPDRVTGVLAFLNVAYITGSQPFTAPGLVAVSQPEDRLEPFVFKVTNLVPRAFVPRQIVPVQSSEEALQHLRTSDDPSARVAVPAGTIPLGLPVTQIGSVQLETYLPDRVDLVAQMETPGLVVLTDAYYPGWKVRVDGVAAEIVRVNDFVRGVFVGAGKRRIVFEYDPLSYRIGLSLTAAFTCVLVALAFRRR
ncbi:MAG: hypothetical protein ACHQ9S_14775 [Candidatus Binatia bacterium]